MGQGPAEQLQWRTELRDAGRWSVLAVERRGLQPGLPALDLPVP